MSEAAVIFDSDGNIVMTVVPDARTSLTDPAFNPPDHVQVRVLMDDFTAVADHDELAKIALPALDEKSPEIADAIRVKADAMLEVKALVPYAATPPATVDLMLKLAEVGPADCVYDLGTGDGRIAIAAAQLGAEAVGIDNDADRIAGATKNAEAAGVKVTFFTGDWTQTDLSGATVIALYGNDAAMAVLTKMVPAKARVVSYEFPFPDRVATTVSNGIYLYGP